jgi:hypothetical protein
VIAQDSGNRNSESFLANSVSRLEAAYGDPLAALDYSTLVIRNYYDAGNTILILRPLGSPRGAFRPASTL